jgi:hypothetical protein
MTSTQMFQGERRAHVAALITHQADTEKAISLKPRSEDEQSMKTLQIYG